MTETVHRHRLRAIHVLIVSAMCLVLSSPVTAEDCGSPCTVTRQGLPTFRLVNTVLFVPDWDLETSAFGVELVPTVETTGVFRVDHFAPGNSIVIDNHGNVGIGTTVSRTDLHITGTSPSIRLDDTSAGAGMVDLQLFDNMFALEGNAEQDIMRIDTRAPQGAFRVDDSGRVALGTSSPEARLHVDGDARIDGNVALGSSRTLKTTFEPISPSQILSKLANLPVASWRYKTEDESARHIGPFAEDFQRLFGLGDGETISIVDAQGVAFAAIQGLKEALDAKDAELAAVHLRNDELTATLTTLRTADADRERELAELRTDLDLLKAALASR